MPRDLSVNLTKDASKVGVCVVRSSPEMVLGGQIGELENVTERSFLNRPFPHPIWARIYICNETSRIGQLTK